MLHPTASTDIRPAGADWLLPVVAMAGFVFLSALFGITLTRDAGRIASLWLANAAILAVLVRSPTGRWPIVLAAAYIANLAANFASGDRASLAFVLPLFNLAEASIAALLLRPAWRRNPHPSNGRTLFVLLLSCGLIAPALSGLGAATLLNQLTGAPFLATFEQWALSDALGMLVLAPVLLGFSRSDFQGIDRTAILTGGGLLLLNAAVTALVFTTSGYPLLFTIVPGLILAAFRTRFIGVAASMLVVAVIATVMTIEGYGPIATTIATTVAERILFLQFFLASTLLMVLPISAILDDQQRLTRMLADSDSQFRLLADHSNDFVARIGLDGLRRYLSPAVTRVLGYTPDEMLGISPMAQIHPDDRARVEATARSLLTGATQPMNSYRQQHKDGSYVWLETSYRLVRDAAGEPAEIIASTRDISGRRAAELEAIEAAARLEENIRLLRLAEQTARMGHWRVDVASGALQWSDNVYHIHGARVGDPASVARGLAYYHPDDRDRVTAQLDRAMADGTPMSFRALTIRDDGVEVPVAVEGIVERGPDGAILSVFGVIQDITEEARAEAELKTALADAEQASHAKSDFLATMSHEIRTPMTGVLGMIELLRGDTTRAERDRYFTSLDQSARVLLAVLDDVLDYSRLESGAIQLEDAPFDLRQLAENTVNLYHSSASAKGLLVTADLPDAAQLPVSGDAVRVQQILSNLVGNAIKFTATGAVVVRVSPPVRGDRWRFEVADTGIGIDPATIDRLFEPFIQADASTVRRFGGSGLGLAICRRLVAAMGGTIDVVSRPGHGSTFRFDLRLKRASAADLAAPVAQADTSTTPLSVLLAEDNAVVAMLTVALLQRAGHQVTRVLDGKAAVAAAATGAFDAVLMDMQMPEMDGMEATRAIRALPGPVARVPIFALTADAAPSRRGLYADVGLNGFIAKPIDAALLAEALSGVAPTASARNDLSARIGAEPLLDIARLTDMSGTLGGDNVQRLLELLKTDAGHRAALILVNHGEGDRPTMRREAHALAGAAESIGARRLAAAARAVEEDGIDTETLAQRLRLLSTAAADTARAISARIAALNADAA